MFSSEVIKSPHEIHNTYDGLTVTHYLSHNPTATTQGKISFKIWRVLNMRSLVVMPTICLIESAHPQVVLDIYLEEEQFYLRSLQVLTSQDFVVVLAQVM